MAYIVTPVTSVSKRVEPEVAYKLAARWIVARDKR